MAPLLIVFAGLPGTGKSTLAREIARREGAVWLRVDSFEAAMLKGGLSRSFETGLAAYICVRDGAADQLELGRDVVIDAVNGVEEAREMWRSLAKERHASLFIIEVICSDVEEHRRRVESRPAPTPPLPALTWEEVIHREYLPWNEQVLTIDSVSPPDANITRILSYLSGDLSSTRPDRAPCPLRGPPATALP